MGVITLRTTLEQDQQLEQLMQFLKIKTKSGAIIETATNYVALSEKKEELYWELKRKISELEEMKQLIKQYKQAQQNLFEVI